MAIYHLASRAHWDNALITGEYRGSTLGASLEQVGYVHASTGAQLHRVAEIVYRDVEVELVVLVLDEGVITSTGTEVRYEDGGDGQLFPHIYGPVRAEWVVRALPAHFDDERRFHW